MHTHFISIISSLKSFRIKQTDHAKKQAGFTLVELLVVIAILGILASAILVAVDPAAQMAKARNATRKAMLKDMANALERYRLFQGAYPIGNYCGAPGSAWAGNCADSNNWIPGLVASGELKRLPKEPREGQVYSPCGVASYTYFIYVSNGTDYKVIDHCSLEVPGSVSPSDPFLDPVRSGYSFAVYTPGGSGW